MITEEAINAGAKALAERNGSSRWESFTGISEAVLSAALPFLPIAVEGKVEWDSPEEWEIEQRAFQANLRSDVPADVQQLVAKLWAMYCHAAVPSSPGKDGGQEVEPVAYARESDIRALTEWGADVSLSSVPMPEYGIRMPLYASPSGSAKHD